MDVPAANASILPSVSLIMTFRDCEQYLFEALDSVSNQTFDDWELVLWDDGSTDESPAIAQFFADHDSRVRMFRSDPIGRRQALSKAHEQALGEFVGWIDADDRLAPSALDRLVDFLRKNPSCGMVYSDHETMSADGTVRGLGNRSHIPYSAHRLLMDFMTFHFRLFRRSIFEQAGGISPNFEIAIDYDLCLRVSEITPIRHLAEPLYFYRQHRGQMSSLGRSEQVEASATAIRAAIARRGLSDTHELQVDEDGRRFQIRDLRPEPQPSRVAASDWPRVLLATASKRFRPQAMEKAPVNRIGYWPADRASILQQHLYPAVHARGVDTYPLGKDLASLIRAVWTGRAGDLLHIHSIDSLLDVPEHGSALANYFMFTKTLDHARARGVRIVWTMKNVTHCGGLHADLIPRFHQALATRCNSIVVRSLSAEMQLRHEVGAFTARVVVSPHPSFVDVYPDVSRFYARKQLGLDGGNEIIFLHFGTMLSPETVLNLIDALASLNRLKQSRIVVAGPAASSEIESQLRSIANENELVQLNLGGIAVHRVQIYFRASDVVMMPMSSTFSWERLMLAMTRGKPVLAPAYPSLMETLPAGNFTYQPTGPSAHAEFRDAVERACLAKTEWDRIGERNLECSREWTWERAADALCQID